MSEEKTKDQSKDTQFSEWIEQMMAACGPKAKEWMTSCAPNMSQACSSCCGTGQKTKD